MNEYDTEKMKVLLSSGYVSTEEIADADLVIVNTCSVREKGEHKLFSLLGQLRELKENKKDLIVGVGGCVAQQEGRAIVDRNRAVDFVVGTHNLSLIPKLVEQVKNGKGSQIAVDYREDWEDLPLAFLPLQQEAKPVISPTQTPVRALVSIQRGCNKNCSYCVVPTTRGPELSRDAREIEREVRAKVRMGAREVLLLGQTVNSYGRDLNPRMRFSDLIRRLAEIEELKRIRFISPHPAEVKDDFIDLYAEVPKLALHIHLPVQSGSDRVLRLMNRNYKIRRYEEIVEKLREHAPEIAISTDVIVGFPTETDEEFNETLSLVRKIRYHSAYYFKYSRRPNTVAIKEFPVENEVPKVVTDERFQRLDKLQTEITTEHNRSETDKVRQVLVEGLSPGSEGLLRARTSQNIIVDFPGDPSLVGQLIDVRITKGMSFHVKGERVSI